MSDGVGGLGKFVGEAEAGLVEVIDNGRGSPVRPGVLGTGRKCARRSPCPSREGGDFNGGKWSSIVSGFVEFFEPMGPARRDGDDGGTGA